MKASEAIRQFLVHLDLRKAQKKVKGLKWGKNSLYESDGFACALGIAALAACAKPEEIESAATLSGLNVTDHLGWQEMLGTIIPSINGFGYDADLEDRVLDINDDHSSSSLADVRRRLRGLAAAQEKAGN